MSRPSSRAALLGAVAVLALLVLKTPSTAGSPGRFHFQSRLTDAQGKPLADGTVNMTFKLFATDPGNAGTPPAPLWSETQNNVQIARGVISVQLGSVTAIDASIFDGEIKYLEITVGNNAPLRPTIPLVSVPYALSAASINGKSDTQVTPIGGIMDWYRPTPQTAIPIGWHVCDGATINDSASPFHGLPVPDLRNVFVRGLDPSQVNASNYAPGLPYPDRGGADSASVNVSHSHGLGNHTHSMPDHNHTFSGQTGRPVGVQVPVSGVFNFINGPIDHVHDYSGTTSYVNGAASATAGVTGSANGSTDTASPSVSFDNRPVYVGLLKIIRIK